jgi:hypothetical protein
LAAEHDELMTQNHQFDVFGELVESPSDQQLQDCGESEICEGKEHPPILPGPTTN